MLIEPIRIMSPQGKVFFAGTPCAMASADGQSTAGIIDKNRVTDVRSPTGRKALLMTCRDSRTEALRCIEGTSALARLAAAGIAAAIGILVALPSTAQPTEVSLGPPELRSLVVETIYPYKLQKYAPELAIAQVRARSALRATPEQTLAEMVSSIAAGDFEWNSSLWDPKSRAAMAERDRQDGHGPAYWLSQWKPHARAAYRLLHRIEYGKYVLIEYERSDAGRQSKSTIALLTQQGQWYLTQEIAGEAILSSWNAPENRVRVVPDGLIRR